MEKSTVLLAEDNENMMLVIQAMLEFMGFDVEHAPNGRIAFEMSVLKPYTAILMDVEMPVMDGLAATKAIRENEHAAQIGPVGIIGMTGHKGTGIQVLCERAGMDALLSKPFLVADLGDKLHRVCDVLPAPEIITPRGRKDTQR